MRFKIKNSNLFLMPGNTHMLHLGTIEYGLREFVVFTCIAQNTPYFGKTYIEEVVLTSKDFSKDITAHCKFIEDDILAFDLAKFAEEQGLIDIKKRTNELLEIKKLKWLTDLKI